MCHFTHKNKCIMLLRSDLVVKVRVAVIESPGTLIEWKKYLSENNKCIMSWRELQILSQKTAKRSKIGIRNRTKKKNKKISNTQFFTNIHPPHWLLLLLLQGKDSQNRKLLHKKEPQTSVKLAFDHGFNCGDVLIFFNCLKIEIRNSTFKCSH